MTALSEYERAMAQTFEGIDLLMYRTRGRYERFMLAVAEWNTAVIPAEVPSGE